jgi:hypothetical protein
MRNERGETSGGAVRVLSGRHPLCAFLVAGVLMACSKSAPGGSGSPGGSGPPGGSATLQSLALTPGDVAIPAGAQQQFAVMGTYSDSTTAAITSGISWSSSSPDVAGLQDGVATGARVGTTTITASVGGLSAQASLTVTSAALQALTISPSTSSIGKGASQQFVATGQYSDGSTATLPFVTWSSSSGLVASIDSGIGLASGVAPGGPVTITATHAESGLSATALLTVTDPVIQSISISPGVSSFPEGYGKQFAASARLSDGTTTALSSGVTWSSSDSAVVTVDAAGLAFGAAVGSASITASYGGFSSAASVTIKAAVPTVEKSVIDLPFAFGETVQDGGSYYKVSGLAPGAEYLVRLTTDASVAEPLLVEVHQDAAFAGLVCSSWAGEPLPPAQYVKLGPPCRAGAPAGDDLFVLVTGPAGTPFTLEVSDIPVLQAGGSVSGAGVTTEAYYKAEGLPGAVFEAALGGLTDVFADIFVYAGGQGPFGSGLLCSTVTADPLSSKSCIGAVPPSGTVYVTVEGWLTEAGTDYTLAVTP